MDQMQSFIEKAKSDSSLLAKLNELDTEGIVAFAAEHGFSITAEDCRQAAEMAGTRKKGELKEEDLEAAAGGGTQNRYDPNECVKFKEVQYRCVGFLGMCLCDHYEKNEVKGEPWICLHTCAMGCFSYKAVSGFGPE